MANSLVRAQVTAMHIDSYGSGAPLLLIHGWGMHGGMWGGVAERLAERFRVLVVDLLPPRTVVVTPV